MLAMFMISCALILTLQQASSVPTFAEKFNAEGRVKLEWLEAREQDRDASAPRVAADFGIFPRWSDQFLFGAQLSTNQGDFGSARSEVNLGNGTRAATIGLRQIYVEYKPVDYLRIRFGKFESMTSASNLLFEPDITWDGFQQTLSKDFGASSIRLSTAQWVIDSQAGQVFPTSRQARTWLFDHALTSRTRLGLGNELAAGLRVAAFTEPSERIQNLAALQGNSYTGPLGNTEVSDSFLPIEARLSAEGLPLNIRTRLETTAVYNPRSRKHARSFMFRGLLGNPEDRRNWVTSMAYFYSEPDTSLALLADDNLGFANRKGVLLAADYYIFDEMRFGGRYLFAETIATSTVQSSRHEFRLEWELRFL